MNEMTTHHQPVELSNKPINKQTIERKEEKTEAPLDWFKSKRSETILNSCKKSTCT